MKNNLSLLLFFLLFSFAAKAQTSYVIRISPYYSKDFRASDHLKEDGTYPNGGDYEMSRIKGTLSDPSSGYKFMEQYVDNCYIFFNRSKNDSVFVGYFNAARQSPSSLNEDFNALTSYYHYAEKVDHKDVSPH